MSLEDKQKLVVELRATPTDDKFYATAKALIAFITGLTGKLKWVEPELGEVKNIAGHDISCDGKVISKDATAKVYPWQAAALSRWVEPSEEFAAVLAKRNIELTKLRPAEAPAPAASELPITEIIKQAVAEGIKEGLKGAGKVAAMILLFACLLLGMNLQAQVQTTALGAPNSYHVYYVAGLNGGTNFILGTNYYTTATITTNTLVSPGIIISNGIAYNNPSTNYTYSTNVPGVVSVPNQDLLCIYLQYVLNTSGTGIATNTWDYSVDGMNWQTNALVITLTGAGTVPVATSSTQSQFGPGYIRLNQLGYPSTTVFMTNVILEVAGKASKTGPF